jgi:hypothetical protein
LRESQSSITYQYKFLDIKQFKKFVNDPSGSSGVLQKFITPPGDKNFTFVVNYTPSSFTMIQRVNLISVNDESHDIEERFSTFQLLSQNIETRPVIIESIINRHKNICEVVAKHVEKVLPRKQILKEGTFVFKLDVGGCIWCDISSILLLLFQKIISG